MNDQELKESFDKAKDFVEVSLKAFKKAEMNDAEILASVCMLLGKIVGAAADSDEGRFELLLAYTSRQVRSWGEDLVG